MKRSNGFRKKIVDHLIGQQYGRLTITGQSPLAGRIQCRCECGTFTEPVMAKVMSGHTASCGCLKAERFKQHWNGKAEKLPTGVQRKVFKMLCAGYYDIAVAKKLKLPKYLIGAIGRVYGAALKAMAKAGVVLKAWEKGYITKHCSLPAQNIIIDLDDTESIALLKDMGFSIPDAESGPRFDDEDMAYFGRWIGMPQAA